MLTLPLRGLLCLPFVVAGLALIAPLRAARATLFDELASACGQSASGASTGQPDSVSLDIDVPGARVATAASTALTDPDSLPISVTASGNGVIVELAACSLGGASEARIVLGFSLAFLEPPPALPTPVPIVIEADGDASVTQQVGFSRARVRAAVGAEERIAEACLGDPFFCPSGQDEAAPFDSPFVVSLLPGDYELVLEAQGAFIGSGSYAASLELLGIGIEPAFPDAGLYQLTVDPIPEPGSLWLASLALAGALALRRGRLR